MREHWLRLSTFTLVLFLLTNFCQAENADPPGLSIGMRVGAGVSNLIGKSKDTTLDKNYIAVPAASGFLSIPFGNNFEIQLEASIYKTGLNRDYSIPSFEGPIEISESLRLTYLEFSLIPKLPFNHHHTSVFSIYTGATAALCIDSKAEGNYVVPSGSSLKSSDFSAEIGNIKKLNLGILFGFEYRRPLGPFTSVFDLRYINGLTEIFEDVDSPDNLPDNKIYYVDYPSGKAADLKDATIRITFGIVFPI